MNGLTRQHVDASITPRGGAGEQSVRIKCGFAELIDPVDYEVVARGSVYAYTIPDVGRGPWDGEISLLRGYEQLANLGGRPWLLRFERGFSQRWIELRDLEREWAPSGLRATARIYSRDGTVPPFVNELGGE